MTKCYHFILHLECATQFLLGCFILEHRLLGEYMPLIEPAVVHLKYDVPSILSVPCTS